MTGGALQGKISVVTGGARGIGAAIAARLSADGATVIIADIDAQAATSQAVLLKNGSAMQIDIGSDASVVKFADFLKNKFGCCNILVNNAAILDMTGINELTMARYRHVLNINQDGAVRLTTALLPLLLADGPGARIVNISSIMGLRGQPNSVPYSMAKGAIANFTRSLAADLGHQGINVNAIAPGFIDTDMAQLPDGSGHEHETEEFLDIYLKYGRILLRRVGQPKDIAGPVSFLCSKDADYITGQVILVDGGVSATF